MPLPSNSSLLGLDYGYDGESFIAIPAKAGVVYGTDVEGFNGEEFFFMPEPSGGGGGGGGQGGIRVGARTALGLALGLPFLR